MINSILLKVQMKTDVMYNLERYRSNDGFYLYDDDDEFIPGSSNNSVEKKYGGIIAWELFKYKSANKIIFKTRSDEFRIPLFRFLGKIDDRDLLNYLAILNSKHPIINYRYYEKGEEYGAGEWKIVQQEKTLIKDITFENSNNDQVDIHSYILEEKKNLSDSELEKLSMKYLEDLENEKYAIEEAENEEINSRMEYEDEKRYFSDDYYNDQLDMDQQSPDFWDSQ